MLVYLKQNEDFLHFLPGGGYDKWNSSEEFSDRIDALIATELPVIDETNAATVTARTKLLAKRRGRETCALYSTSLVGRSISMISTKF